MNKKKITLQLIAQKANVSIATVSRVLNGNECVDERIKNKINEIIKSDGYNRKKKNKKIISVIIPDITNPLSYAHQRTRPHIFLSYQHKAYHHHILIYSCIVLFT